MGDPLQQGATAMEALFKETNLKYIALIGLALFILGFLWQVWRTLKWSKVAGLGVLFLGLAAIGVALYYHFNLIILAELGALLALPLLIFGWQTLRKSSRKPAWIMILGWVLLATAFGTNRLLPRLLPRGPHENIVDGQLHLTLTGWNGKNYDLLRYRQNAVVLQMANPDVTDETVKLLLPDPLVGDEGMKDLIELDLGHSRVTDQGLIYLQSLPKLAKLKINDTKITPEGVKAFLNTKTGMLEIDVRGLQVDNDFLWEWKQAKEGRQVVPRVKAPKKE